MTAPIKYKDRRRSIVKKAPVLGHHPTPAALRAFRRFYSPESTHLRDQSVTQQKLSSFAVGVEAPLEGGRHKPGV